MSKILFEDSPNDWKEEWREMPEYLQKREKAYQEILIRFFTKDEVQDFATLLSCNITPQTKTIVYSALQKDTNQKLRYADES